MGKENTKISILMLTYNAANYVLQSILSLKKCTADVEYELVVVDNNSKWLTKTVLRRLLKAGYIDKLYLNGRNDLFAGGNNLAAGMADADSEYFLLLNSDVKIKDKHWLVNLMNIHPSNGGISAYGAVLSEPKRADGYCLLIDKELYLKYKLDENFQWWWSVTKLEGEVLKENKEVVAVIEHESQIHHYGGKSGKGYKDAKGMNIEIEEVKAWFAHGAVRFIQKMDIPRND